MRSRLSLILCFATVLLFLAACSSSTVVSSDDRVSAPAEPSVDIETNPTPSPTPAAADDSVGVDAQDPGTDDDGTSSDRGDRDPEADGTDVELEATDGFGLGGAEQLQGLLTDCEGGQDLACDILFQISNVNSVEESAALTCGGRSDVEVFFCTEGFEPIAGELFFDEASPGLPAVVTLCEGGDMTACDFLFFRSPLQSSYEELGSSCGGRVDVAVPDCRTFLSESE